MFVHVNDHVYDNLCSILSYYIQLYRIILYFFLLFLLCFLYITPLPMFFVYVFWFFGCIAIYYFRFLDV